MQRVADEPATQLGGAQQMTGLAPRALALPEWPEGATVAVALTFDTDADPAMKGDTYLDASAGALQGGSRLSFISQSRYGVVRGLPRILGLLDRQGISATFFVPGATAEAYPDAIRAIVAGGHEIGHHGYEHLPPHVIDAELQKREIERGLEALKTVGVEPVGYRAPYAELTHITLETLVQHGFAYDSSCMGDDRPYLECSGDLSILELPIEWHLDDAPFMLADLKEVHLEHAGDVLRQWWEDFVLAAEQRTLITLVMHPEIIGRGSRSKHLERLIEQMKEHAKVWFPTHREVAELLRAQGIHEASGSRL
jgi:peptidoglycan-N-acetylglucosamine deacetylase